MNTRHGLWLVLIGPHGAGKTTIGRAVARHLNAPFDEEIGKVLAQQVMRKNPRHCADVAPPQFDAEILQRELLRDTVRPGARVVETWHPGNLAFSFERNPDVFRHFWPRFATYLPTMQGLTVIQPLRVERSTARQRQSEHGPNDERLHNFFWQVGAKAEELTRDLGLTCLPPVHTDHGDVETCVAEVLANIRTIFH